MLTRDHVERTVAAYGAAWVGHSAGAIAALFAEDGVYVERPYDKTATFKGRRAIEEYWRVQVVATQRNIVFHSVVDDFILDAERCAAMVKWEASFDVVGRKSGQPERSVRFVQARPRRKTQSAARAARAREMRFAKCKNTQ